MAAIPGTALQRYGVHPGRVAPQPVLARQLGRAAGVSSQHPSQPSGSGFGTCQRAHAVRACSGTTEGLAATDYEAAVPLEEARGLHEAFTAPQMELITTDTLTTAVSLAQAVQLLQHAVHRAASRYQHHQSGIVRIEVPVPQEASALRWLQGQSCQQLQPSFYYSPRRSPAPETPSGAAASAGALGPGAVAGVGAAWQWKGDPSDPLQQTMNRHMKAFLSGANARVRIFGAARFDSASAPSPEWAAFGSHFCLLPRIELLEAGSHDLLSCTLAWNPHIQGGPAQLPDAVAAALSALALMQPAAPAAAPAFQVTRLSTMHTPDKARWQRDLENVHDSLSESATTHAPQPLSSDNSHAALKEFSTHGQMGLDDLLEALDGGLQGTWHIDEEAEALAKVVMARRSDITIQGQLSGLSLLQALQERDPQAYQVYLRAADGATFFGSTPERLYVRTGSTIASEAVAATRARGPAGNVEQDFWLSLDLLRSPKDHAEFTLVRDWVRNALQGVCASCVDVDVEKSVLRAGSVQHLYGRLSGTLHPDADDAQILAALHPTPATCGRPRDKAQAVLADSEPFDRGLFAGPFGWLSGSAAEFCVAIRSALITPAQPAAPSSTGTDGLAALSEAEKAGMQQVVRLFAGVGVVKGSHADSEWQELDLKIAAINRLLHSPPPLKQYPSVNSLWAGLLVEELCRLGANTFCIAPGSRSTPLTAAVAQHPRARVVPCIDERSLAFWAVGYGRATGLPAVVITSSGTAVANLLPAVVEASQSHVPLILLTADRPGDLRDTGANQTIDQVKIFGSYPRWAMDIPPPNANTRARVALTNVDTAMRWATCSTRPGPVHLNCQFEEPLVPRPAQWSTSVLQGLESWQQSALPFTQHMTASFNSTSLMTHQAYPAAPQGGFWESLRGAQRGLIVVGEMMSQQEAAAAAAVCRTLQWPVATDVLSGLRLGTTSSSASTSATESEGLHHIPYLDHVLLERESAWPAVRPDVVLQLGGRVVSKRIGQFLEWAATDGERSSAWILVNEGPERHDAAHLLTHHVQMPLQTFCSTLVQALPRVPVPGQAHAYTCTLLRLNSVVEAALEASMTCLSSMSEPQVARDLSRLLPAGHALFLGNSMPIRDMDMYAAPCTSQQPALQQLGYAVGLQRPTTLVVGDVSFVHDTNGLTLLRAGESAPPLTVVLINNAGGGIFSMLPHTDTLPPAAFTQLWTTPPLVDLMGLCQAHGIAHQRVTQHAELAPALANAWALNKPSVVEVVTCQQDVVLHHRAIQAEVSRSVRKAVHLMGLGPRVVSLQGDWLLQELSCQRTTLPLTRPLATIHGHPSLERQVAMIRLTLRHPQTGQEVIGVGEIAPLPGVSKESLKAAVQQVAVLSHTLRGCAVSPLLALLQGQVTAWLQQVISPRPHLFPSVHFSPGGTRQGVQISGLLGCQGSVEQCIEEAVQMVAEGHRTLKLKVGRRADPLQDAAVVLGVRERVGSDVALRADANRSWTLEQATAFLEAAAPAGLELLEEPLCDFKELPTLAASCQVPLGWRMLGVSRRL
ncbi:hypothetical protein WJX73_002942 [Symbiochloris irregularis]|uniref:Mandelate racemase/muconate lactonizing enzyme C-terminal domain-containing protein n=1 Tax=Symbiochloris irregularis TaxID=706552 RepID=A0AAW1PDC9_9CHLO